ncbi:MAG: MBL fold metallo-hydrolase [Acidobacteriia bacterium]|nr:MBL fold metallo-hydrolase [Terriglobia bacterium]MBV9743768.1 MBL fold metallo-hydrolase [Terriglobia bacterium]
MKEPGIVSFCVLASGSSGNAALLATDNALILIDAGLSLRELTRRLALVGEDVERLDAVLVTHEHSDHIAGLATLARSKKFRAKIYLTRLTAPSIDWGEGQPRLQTFQAGASFDIGDIEVNSFSVPHDAMDPVGFCFETGGVRIATVTDLGYLPESVKYHLRRTDLVLLEANHDLEMLKVGPYPWQVKQRVMSRVGHLSNRLIAEYLGDEFPEKAAHLVLGHLSEQNNHPEIVRDLATRALDGRGLRTRLSIAGPHDPSEVFRF